MTVLTPTVGSTARRALFWVGGAIFVVVIALIAFGTAGSSSGGPPLDPTNPAPAGAMALAEVLGQQGVRVAAASTLDEARDAVVDAGSTTVLIYDPADYLDDDQLRDAVAVADRVVLVDPTFGQLQAVAPGIAQAGSADDPLEADCDVVAVQKAGTVSGESSGYRIVDSPGAVGCLGSGDGVYSLIQLETTTGVLVVLGTTAALSNEFIVNDGNAALGLNLLGQTDDLVWYLPTLADVSGTGATPAELTPGWVTPVLVLLALTFVAAAVWRGRRFGPLVVENLPVTVRASETMLGRARLYETSSSRLRALDALRIGAIRRLATACGLPRTASVDEVIATVATVTGTQPASIRKLLLDANPATDVELVALSDALLTLERDVAIAVRP